MNGVFFVISFLFFKLSPSNSLSVDEKCQLQNQTFRVYFWDKQPYVYESSPQDSTPKGFFVPIIEEALKQCCLATSNIVFIKEKPGPAGLQRLLDGGSFDLLVPVHGFSDSSSVRGFPFISVAESAGVAVLMPSNASGTKLLLSVLKAWPVLVFIIVSALLAGVLMWILERNGKFNQFSKSFCLGIFEGFWWAFCTMTTVGYGDRAPKTVVGKIFGSIWMLVGVIIVTMFISIITTSLTTASYAQYTNIRQMTVSVVNQSTEHILAIRSNSKQIIASPNQQQAFDRMINRDVEASLIDTHALKYHMPRLTNIQHIVVATVVTYHVSYGVLLPSKASLNLETCLRDFMDVQEAWRFELLRKGVGGKKIQITPAQDYFGSGGIFSISVYSGVALFFVFIIVGLIWECQKPKKQNSHHLKLLSLQARTQSVKTDGGVATSRRKTTFNSVSGPTVIMEQTKRPHVNKPQIRVCPPTHPESSGDTPWEKLIARQKMEVMNLENDFYRFEKEWEKRYKDLQMKQNTSETCQLDTATKCT